jgi:hypothetical protein
LAFTAPKPSRAIKNFLPMSREWKIVTLQAAEPAERVLLIHQMALGEDLTLSPQLSKLMADHMPGNGRTISGALKRLRLSGKTWSDTSSALRALGVLDPFFSDNSAWDLKLKIVKVAEAHGSHFSTISVPDLTLFLMLHEAGLAEIDIARSVGVEPSDVYTRANRFKASLPMCATSRQAVRKFTELVLDSIARD